MNIAVVPARGGSKRIPRKNIKLFNGLPVIAHAINTARNSGLFEDVFVTTDDSEIADIATSFGAKVPWIRGKELSNDFATTLQVMQDAVTRIQSDLKSLQNVCCIYPVTPLLQRAFLEEALNKLEDNGWDYVISATKVKTPPERLFTVDQNSQIRMYFPKHEASRTQDVSPAFQDAGQFYWGKTSSWVAGLPLFTSKSTFIELPQETFVDVDTIDDWKYAEILFSIYGNDSN